LRRQPAEPSADVQDDCDADVVESPDTPTGRMALKHVWCGGASKVATWANIA
jgi:hypothetical protein